MKTGRTSSRQIEACHQALGSRIRLIRETLGVTQEELSKRVRYTRATIANVETGRHRFLLNVVEEFAVALGTTPKSLLKGIWW